mmetsp:Transcript_15291/g.35792  ORF Transcript_15291/g.35792 Transcript_15291/m.35792 type:complete len:285 (+) Transcript_15291:217-1071(+)
MPGAEPEQQQHRSLDAEHGASADEDILPRGKRVCSSPQSLDMPPGVLGNGTLSRDRRGLRAHELERHWWSHRETVEQDGLTAGPRRVRFARALSVFANAVHPKHLIAVPVANDGSHAFVKCLVHCLHVVVFGEVDVNVACLVALPGHLRQDDLHCLQRAILVHREGNGNLEWSLGIYALGVRAVVSRLEAPWSVPVLTTAAVASSHPGVVVHAMERGVPRVEVALLDVYLGTRDTADAVRVAVVVAATGRPPVLVHVGQVHRRVAPTSHARDVRGVAQGPIPQV